MLTSCYHVYIASIGDLKFAIEYDGYYFHSGVLSGDKVGDYLKDKQKTQALLDAGYKVIRIREENYAGKLDFLELEDENLLQLNHVYSNQLKPDTFDSAIKEMKKWVI